MYLKLFDMKKTAITLISFFLSIYLFAQVEYESPLHDSIPNNKDYFDRVTFNLGGGVFIPQGKLQQYFGTGPLLEFNFNFPIQPDKSIDVAAQFILPNQQENFAFARTIDTVTAQSQMMFNFFAKFNKTLNSTKNSKLKVFLGAGISTITTNARNPFYSGAEDENKYEFISAILIAPGFDCKFQLSDNAKMAIGVNYHYSPYRLEGALQEDIGSTAIVPRIQLTF